MFLQFPCQCFFLQLFQQPGAGRGGYSNQALFKSSETFVLFGWGYVVLLGTLRRRAGSPLPSRLALGSASRGNPGLCRECCDVIGPLREA